MTLPVIFLGATLACLVYWFAERFPLDGLFYSAYEDSRPRRTLLHPVERYLERLLLQAGLGLRPRLLLRLMLAGAALGAFLAWPFRSGILVAVAAAVLGAAPYQFVLGRIRTRSGAINTAMEPALISLAKLCEVRRHPFLALTDAVPLLDEPLRAEFARAVAETQAGLPLPDALRRLAVRCSDNFYLHQLAELVALNIRSGGDLGAGLERLAARLRTLEELKAEETAELFGYRWLTRILFGAALLPLPYWALTGSGSLRLFMEEPLARSLLVWVVVSGLAIAWLPYWLAIEE